MASCLARLLQNIWLYDCGERFEWILSNMGREFGQYEGALTYVRFVYRVLIKEGFSMEKRTGPRRWSWGFHVPHDRLLFSMAVAGRLSLESTAVTVHIVPYRPGYTVRRLVILSRNAAVLFDFRDQNQPGDRGYFLVGVEDYG